MELLFVAMASIRGFLVRLHLSSNTKLIPIKIYRYIAILTIIVDFQEYIHFLILFNISRTEVLH